MREPDRCHQQLRDVKRAQVSTGHRCRSPGFTEENRNTQRAAQE